MNAAESYPRGRVTLTHLWYVLPAFMLLAVIWGFGEITPADFWWHIRTGQVILELRRIPRIDLYSFTHMGEPWMYQSWLMEIILYLIYRAGGAPLTLLAHGLFITTGYLFLQKALLLIAPRDARVSATITIAVAVLSMQNWAVRPQSISFTLFGLVMYLLTRYQRLGGRVLWWLPPVFLIWANAHGGFIFGLGLLGCFTLSHIWETYRSNRTWAISEVILPIALALLVLAINPAGPIGLVNYVLGFVRHPITRSYNMEFQPLSVRTFTGASFVVLVVLLIAILIRKHYCPNLFESLCLLVFGTLALWAIRNPPWFGFVAAPVAARALAMRPTAKQRISLGNYQINRLLLLCLIVLDIICLPWFRAALPRWGERHGVIRQYTPVDATTYACEHFPSNARVFNEMEYGSYIIWACPQLPVFIDTRFELYSPDEWEEYLAISYARYDWQRILDQYKITHLFLHPERQENLINAATESPYWQLIYQDDVSVIFARSDRFPQISAK